MDWFHTTFNEPVAVALKKAKLSCRPGAGAGSWLSLLLPLALVVGCVRSPEPSPEHQLAAVFATGMFGAAAALLLHLLHAARSDTSPRAFSPLFFVPAGLTALLLLLHSHRGVAFSLAGGLFSTFPFCAGVPLLLQLVPRSFSFGEACVAVQAVLLFLWSAALNLAARALDEHLDALQKVTLILQAGVLGLGLVGAGVALLPSLRQPRPFCALVVGVMGGAVVPGLCLVLRENPVVWIALFIAADVERVYLVVYWAVCSGVAAVAVTTQVQDRHLASTAVRKTFHLLMLAVYLPGLAWECTLMYLASGVAFAALVFLEMVRQLGLTPLSEGLQQGFLVFADDKDLGGVALTPLYLLAGCSGPLWLHPARCTLRSSLPVLAGLLSVGAGDTAASVVGSNLGKHHWQGSKKTKEGTIACILAQMAVIFLLIYVGFLPLSLPLVVRSAVAVVAVSLSEAWTDQVDNLVLPLLMYLLLL